MATRDIIVVGASAGGVEVLCQLARGLPAGFPAAVLVVCHTPSVSQSRLPDILSQQGPLLARHAADGDPVYPGQILIAPPDFHLVVKDGHVGLAHGPRENHHRPAIDPLFRTAARAYGRRVIGVIVSGSLFDGAGGLMAVRAAGGLAVVQDPDDASVSAMPRTAAQLAGVDHVTTAAGLAPLLVDLVQRPADANGDAAMTDPIEHMTEIVDQDMAEQARGGRNGKVSVFSCPECGGSLWQVNEKTGLIRFRCHVGHAYQAEALLEEQSVALEAALWTAIRTFKEKVILSRQLADRERRAGNGAAAARFEEDAALAQQYANLMQQYLVKGLGNGGAIPPPIGGDSRPAPAG